MTFDELSRQIWRKQAEFSFELARTTDPYRLTHLLNKLGNEIGALTAEASEMVRELEEVGNGSL